MDINTHFSSQIAWIKQQLNDISITPLTGDAGFRRYYRVRDNNNHSYIFVDASDEPSVFQAYCLQSEHLASYDLPIPKLIAVDKKQSYALLTDFGDNLFFDQLTIKNSKKLYKLALDTLSRFHRCDIKAFGIYAKLGSELMHEELLGFQEWYLKKFLQKTLSTENQKKLSNSFELIIQKIIQQPYVFMHRDYHSKNIFLLEKDQVSLIDFQDAMAGPVTYDIASLLRDCYVNSLDNQAVERLVLYYKKQNKLLDNISDAQFIIYFDYTGLQRHLKAICTFARKAVRDDDKNYLEFIPRTLDYIINISSKYPELEFLNNYARELL